MISFKNLKQEVIDKLERILKEEVKYRPRLRAQAVLLNNRGLSVKEIAKLMNQKQETVYDWFTSFRAREIDGLYDKAGRGRKHKIKKNF
jgi:transposase